MVKFTKQKDKCIQILETSLQHNFRHYLLFFWKVYLKTKLLQEFITKKYKEKINGDAFSEKLHKVQNILSYKQKMQCLKYGQLFLCRHNGIPTYLSLFRFIQPIIKS